MGASWLPLESNPEVMQQYAQALGLPETATFVDVFGTDPELLAMVPRPVLAVLLLYPITEVSEAHSSAEQAKVESSGQTVSPNVYFTKQVIGNACGTIGIVHAILNNADKIPLDGFFKRFLDATVTSTPMERASALEVDPELAVAHEAAGKAGQTEAPEASQEVDLHFICFVEKDGSLYEMDGRKSFPINHGPTSSETLLEDSVAVVQKFIERDPQGLRFNMIALAANE
eukprot:TRINITY_DN9761_c0_g1::TRINITY_DN9761_c0_g1_i1::g.4873::m.4873 TRINITY_DN9761_c0_g1::TRINITY_DN9761_c0_g1_i1::g.4873  ORF type:complete len:229 (+),score=33.05,sp/P15374/UCHL3_HUMAN/57.27/9e-90,Peptidase_C12/PF01088.16/2.4e-68 TRINITY_DN9761_c0_g1_i1:146-832(+)